MKRLIISLLTLSLTPATFAFDSRVFPPTFTCQGTPNLNLTRGNPVYTPEDEKQLGLSQVTVQVGEVLPQRPGRPSGFRSVVIQGTKAAMIEEDSEGKNEVFDSLDGMTHLALRTDPRATKLSNTFFLVLNELGKGSLELTLTSGQARVYTYDLKCSFAHAGL